MKALRIVITGAAGGIGRAATKLLEQRGHSVAGIDLQGGQGLIAGDVTQPDSIARAIAAARGQLGGLDVLVNNAGVGWPSDAGATPDGEARHIMEVNFFGAWNATAAALADLLEARGHIVNVASGLALVDFPRSAAYSASKRALDAYSGILAAEYRGRLSVTVVYPGYIRTAIHDRAISEGASLEGLARAETLRDAARGLVRACERRPRRVALTRRSAIEYWLVRHMPHLVESVLSRRFQEVVS